jgi:hypothetical protein
MAESGGRYDWSAGSAAGLLDQAAAVLSRESSWLPTSGGSSRPTSPTGTPGVPDLAAAVKDFGNRICPVTGAALPIPGADKGLLQQQAHELVAGLLAAFGQAPMPGNASGRVCPVTHATPQPFFDKDRLRKQAHEFIETLLITFSDATGERGLPAEDKVPLVQCEAPVPAGSQARAMVTVGNEEAAAFDVSLYCTNLVADSGAEIPSLCTNISPRRATIPPGGETTFRIGIAVPQQTPAGTYSSLIQATGTKYVKAVLSLEVT